MLSLIKKIPWWFWAGIFIFILLVWQGLSGWAMSRKLYNMALDNLRHDRSRVIEVLEENMATYEKEIFRITTELEANKKQQAVARAENERLKGLINEKDSQIWALWKERENWIPPADPDALMDELRKRGLRPVLRR